MIWNALGKLALGQRVRTGAAAFSVTADTGTFTLTGNAAALPVVFPADTGSFAITGNAAALPVVAPADVGSFTLTGTSTNLLSGYRLDAQPYVTQSPRHVLWSSLGGAALGQARRSVRTDTTTFEITSQAATFTALRPADAGAFAIVGNDANLARFVAHETGTFTITGQEALFLVSMPAETGVFVTTSNVVEFRRPSRKIRGYPRTGGNIAGRGLASGTRAVGHGIGRGARAVGYGG